MLLSTPPTNNYQMKGSFDGTWVRLGPEGRSLYDQSGYGRPEKDGLRLAPEEALYLLHRGRLEISGYSFDRLLAVYAQNSGFIRSFLVYRDLRERGYVVQTGPHDFRVFRRGQRPGTGQSQYLVRVISERDMIEFSGLVKEVSASINLRKQHVLAVVDDENELTYYEIKVQHLQETGDEDFARPLKGELVGRYAIVHQNEKGTYGMQLDPGRLVLAPLEIISLMRSGRLSLSGEGERIDPGTYYGMARESDTEFPEKVRVYEDLRHRGYVPRTGYKFGHHFRVYSGKKVHSEMLVQALPDSASLPMSAISRSVRLAHSVKKKMLFGCENSKDIQYVEFARIKL
ncbi:MAG: tRNA-splicing endonuclease [Methanoregulaceae archaeon PtaB.Bin108]|nr:MAG: tRNA-splicing endonuclease [Methanoregulaceae archaeon PtaB.Bin108]OPY45653.1 MAG: tRNA-splicing endonuclease [Methanoregulaceae archaeon PtaU1.Bin222]